jgi:hypothetical protein
MKKHRKTPKKKSTYFEQYDLYSDANPKDTIPVRYDTMENLKKTIRKLERIYKNDSYSHARIVQVVNVIKQRLRVMVDRHKKGKRRLSLVTKYFDFLTKKRTPTKKQEARKRLIFKI